MFKRFSGRPFSVWKSFFHKNLNLSRYHEFLPKVYRKNRCKNLLHTIQLTFYSTIDGLPKNFKLMFDIESSKFFETDKPIPVEQYYETK